MKINFKLKIMWVCVSQLIVVMELNSNFYLNSYQENIIHGTIFAHSNPFGRGSAISTVIGLLRVVTSVVVIAVT